MDTRGKESQVLKNREYHRDNAPLIFMSTEKLPNTTVSSLLLCNKPPRAYPASCIPQTFRVTPLTTHLLPPLPSWGSEGITPKLPGLPVSSLAWGSFSGLGDISSHFNPKLFLLFSGLWSTHFFPGAMDWECQTEIREGKRCKYWWVEGQRIEGNSERKSIS